jgi:hypothetical protein
MLQHLEILHFRPGLDQPFGQGKTESEILQIVRGGHHHSERSAIANDRDGRFTHQWPRRGERLVDAHEITSTGVPL